MGMEVTEVTLEILGETVFDSHWFTMFFGSQTISNILLLMFTICSSICLLLKNRPLNRYIIALPSPPHSKWEDILQDSSCPRYGLQSSCVVDYSYAGAGFFGPPGRGASALIPWGQWYDFEVFMVDDGWWLKRNSKLLWFYGFYGWWLTSWNNVGLCKSRGHNFRITTQNALFW